MGASARRAIARRTFADSRIRTGAFASFFALYAYANAAGYRHTYPTLEDRVAFARSFGTNKAVELFYGAPHDLLSVGGFTAWRFGGFTAIIAGIWGLLAAVRALRAEEDAGRQELVLAGVVSRRGALGAVLLAIAAGAAILWLAFFLGLAGARLAAGGSAYLALAAISPIPVFVGLGALAAQAAPTRRLALELAGAVLALALLLRVVADLSTGLGWLRWTTPLGWSEELRAFASPRPVVLLLPGASGLILLLAAALIAVRRDVGSGLLEGRETAEPRLHLLSSPTALALRSEIGSLAGWLAATGAYAIVIGTLSTSFSSSSIPASLRRQLGKLGASIATPSGALGVYFLLFVFAISLFACAQVAAARHEEADQRLETLLASPVARARWLAGRLLLAALGALGIAFSVSIFAWAGATIHDAGVSLPSMLEAGANCLPTAFLFLSLAALAFALVPRASAGISYGLVSVAFVWQLLGALVGAPHWLLELTPFQHVGLVPAQPFRPDSALVMVGLAAVSLVAATWMFERRDLTSA
jgi:polyether ionophore transport system permease protein